MTTPDGRSVFDNREEAHRIFVMGLSGGGELLAFQQPSPSVRQIIFDKGIIDENFYQALKHNGTVVIGPPKADVGCNRLVSVDGALHLLTVAMQPLPTLSPGSTQRMWSGLRTKRPTAANSSIQFHPGSISPSQADVEGLASDSVRSSVK